MMAESMTDWNEQFGVAVRLKAVRRSPYRSAVSCAIASTVLLTLFCPASASAIDLFPVATTGHDADIVYEMA